MQPVRMPTRNGRVVSAISEVLRLVPKPTPKDEALRAESSKLYRSIMRTLYRAPTSQARTETYQHARREFERNRSVADPLLRENHLRTGWNEYRMFAHYFEEQRHFTQPALQREFPQKRVAVLRDLLKVTPVARRQRVRMLLRGAEQRAERLEGLNSLLSRAEEGWTLGNRMEFEWRGILEGIRARMEKEAVPRRHGG